MKTSTKISIKITLDEELNLWTVIINDKVSLECLTEKDIHNLTMKEILDLLED